MDNQARLQILSLVSALDFLILLGHDLDDEPVQAVLSEIKKLENKAEH